MYLNRNIVLLSLLFCLSFATVFGQKKLYNVEISTFGHTFDGIMLSKENSVSVRTVLLTKTGLKIFDLTTEKHKTAFHFNYIMPDMDRKPVKQSIGCALFLLGFEKITGERIQHKNREKTTDGKTMIVYYDSAGSLVKKRGFGLCRIRIKILYHAHNIVIKQPGIKMILREVREQVE